MKKIKKVTFNNVIEYEPDNFNTLTNLKRNDTLPDIFTWWFGVACVWLIIFLIIWIMGLVRMGQCNGRQSWLWWTTIFIPLFVPGIGQVWGFIVGLIAIIKLRNGGTLLNMHCKN